MNFDAFAYALAYALSYALANVRAANTPVVLSYGLGADSTAILLRWLEDPTSRDFDLADLTVVTAMTGDEFADTGRLVRDHVLPRLAEAGVRFVQVARAGALQADGYAVLSDSRSTDALYLEGVYKLSDELRAAGTVPQVASGKRLCSQKFKGWVLDSFLADDLGGRSFRHVMGFNAEETKRAERDDSYSTEVRNTEYPLIEWGWDRATLEAYIESVVGEPWAKSCCSFCPFAKDHHQGRYASNPEAAADAMMIELTSIALNPRSTLFKNRSVIDVTEANVPAAAEAFYGRLDETEWAIYDVRRIMYGKGVAWRSVRTVETSGSHVLLHRRIREIAEVEGGTFAEGKVVRLVLSEREEGVYPSTERFLVIAPAGAEDKERPSFAKNWAKLTEPEQAA